MVYHPRAALAVDTHAHAGLTSWRRGRKWSCAEAGLRGQGASDSRAGAGMLPRPGAAHRNGEGSGGDPPESPGRVPSRRTGPLPVALSRLDRHRWLTREGGLQGQHGGPGEGQWRNGSSWGGGAAAGKKGAGRRSGRARGRVCLSPWVPAEPLLTQGLGVGLGVSVACVGGPELQGGPGRICPPLWVSLHPREGCYVTSKLEKHRTTRFHSWVCTQSMKSRFLRRAWRPRVRRSLGHDT